MQSDLLKKEDEFYKENEKLEQKTKELMKKVNNVMKIQDNLVRETFKTKNDLIKANICSDKIDYHHNSSQYMKAITDLKNEDLNLPSSVEEMGKKGVIHFYKAKIKSLQEENMALHNENKKKGDEIKKLQKENQSISEEKDKWFGSYNIAKNTIGKLESQISAANSKLQSKDGEMASVKKEMEQLRKELKNCNLNLNNFEVRLNRAHEENDKLKTTLKSTKDEEKELKENYRKQINDLTATVKRIEQHKTELLNGFKKQLQLIDNLKKQKLYLETYNVAEISETEYLKILDWKLD